jgi:hypothetical protein
LELQKRLNLEVLLPIPDFNLQIARILQNDCFSEEKQSEQTHRIKPPTLPNCVTYSNKRDPKDLTVFCELDEKTGEIRRYEVLLTSKKQFCDSDNIVMQVLQSSNDEYYFNIAITYDGKRPNFCWKKKYGLALAREIFERWYELCFTCKILLIISLGLDTIMIVLRFIILRSRLFELGREILVAGCKTVPGSLFQLSYEMLIQTVKI